MDGDLRSLPPSGEPSPAPQRSARILPVNRHGQVLLLHGIDPARPASPYWFSIGGTVEPGESPAEAAVRELLEETGIRVDEDALVGPVHLGTHRFRFRGVDRWNESIFFAVAVDDVTVTFTGLQQNEIGTIRGAGWWDPSALADGIPLSNPALPAIAAAAVRAIRPSPD